MTKLLILLAAAISIIAAAFLYSSGLPWDLSLMLGCAFGFGFLAVIDWLLDGVTIFRPIGERIVADWKHAWRWLSVQMMALAGILQVVGLAVENAWLVVPPALVSAVDPGTLQVISLIVLGLGIAGRVLKQSTPAAK